MSKLKPGARVPAREARRARVPAREARRLTNIDLAHPRDAPAAEAPLLPRPQMPRITRVVRRWQSRARSLTTPHTASVGGRRSGNGRSVCSTGFSWFPRKMGNFPDPALLSTLSWEWNQACIAVRAGRAGSSVSVSSTLPEASSGVDRGRGWKGKAWATRGSSSCSGRPLGWRTGM